MNVYSEVLEAGTCVVGFVCRALPRFFVAYLLYLFCREWWCIWTRRNKVARAAGMGLLSPGVWIDSMPSHHGPTTMSTIVDIRWHDGFHKTVMAGQPATRPGRSHNMIHECIHDATALQHCNDGFHKTVVAGRPTTRPQQCHDTIHDTSTPW